MIADADAQEATDAQGAADAQEVASAGAQVGAQAGAQGEESDDDVFIASSHLAIKI